MHTNPVLTAVTAECRSVRDQLVYRTADVIRRDTGDVERVWISSLVDQLHDAAYPSNELKSGGGGGKPGSRPPANLDAVDLYDEIMRACRRRCSVIGTDLGDLVHAATDRVIGSAEALDIRAWTKRLRTWRDRIKTMSGADPIRLRSLPIPCPSCGARWTTDLVDQDEPGVRTDAVFVEFHGDAVQAFGCHACGDIWRGVDLDALVDWQLGQKPAA